MKKVLFCLSLVLIIFGIVVFNSSGAFASEYTHDEDSFFEFLTSSEKNKYAIPVDTWIAFNSTNEVTSTNEPLENGDMIGDLPMWTYDMFIVSNEDSSVYYSNAKMYIQTFYRINEMDPNNSPYDFSVSFCVNIQINIDSSVDNLNYHYEALINGSTPFVYNNVLDNINFYLSNWQSGYYLKFDISDSNSNLSEYFYLTNYHFTNDINIPDFSFKNTSLYNSYTNYLGYAYYKNSLKDEIYDEAYADGAASIDQEAIRQEGYDEGYSVGIKETDTDKYYEAGWTDGANSVDTEFFYQEGYEAGFEDGKYTGTSSVDTDSYFNNGYDAGFIAGADSVDINEFYQQGFEDGISQEVDNDKTFFDYIVDFFNSIGDFFKDLFN